METTTINKKQLDYPLQTQQRMMWCWSAVGTSSALFYKPDSGWTQCKMANSSIVPTPGVNCCINSNEPTNPCNTDWYINNGKGLGSFVTAGIDNGLLKEAISFEDLIQQIDKGCPVAYCLHFNEFDKKPVSLNHFVVISGYDNSGSKKNITVNDPFFGTSEVPYDEFIKNYKSEAKVIYTFFTKPPK